MGLRTDHQNEGPTSLFPSGPHHAYYYEGHRIFCILPGPAHVTNAACESMRLWPGAWMHATQCLHWPRPQPARRLTAGCAHDRYLPSPYTVPRHPDCAAVSTCHGRAGRAAAGQLPRSSPCFTQPLLSLSPVPLLTGGREDKHIVISMSNTGIEAPRPVLCVNGFVCARDGESEKARQALGHLNRVAWLVVQWQRARVSAKADGRVMCAHPNPRGAKAETLGDGRKWVDEIWAQQVVRRSPEGQKKLYDKKSASRRERPPPSAH